MPEIHGFAEIRRDGKVIDESTKVADMIARGWGPEPVTSVRWEFDSRTVLVSAPNGINAKVVPARNFVAAIEHPADFTEHSTLVIINGDGTRRLAFSNIQPIRGEPVRGEFSWFEQALAPGPDRFGVVFRALGTGELFRLDIDAAGGRVLGTLPIR